MLDLISHILKFFNTLVLFFYLNMIVPNCLYSPPFLNMVLNKKDVSAMILKPIYCIFHIMLPFLNVSHITQPTFSSPDKPTCFPLDPSQICSHLNLLQFNNRYKSIIIIPKVPLLILHLSLLLQMQVFMFLLEGIHCAIEYSLLACLY